MRNKENKSHSEYSVLLVYSTSHALRIEKALKAEKILCKLIPVPRQLSSDCGVCVRIGKSKRDAAAQALEKLKVELQGIFDL